MCQTKSDTNLNVQSFGFLDRDQKLIVTYARSKLARTKSSSTLKAATSIDCITIADMENDYSESCSSDTSNFQIELNKQDVCDKEIATTATTSRTTITECKMHEISDDTISDQNQYYSQIFSQNDRVQQSQPKTVFSQLTNNKRIQTKKSNSFSPRIFRTKVSDYLLVLVCLTFLTVHPVFAKPHPSLVVRHHYQQIMEAQLRSPCGKDSVALEELTRANVKEILNVIKTQTANAKVYASEDIEKYMQHRPATSSSVEKLVETDDSDKKLRFAESTETRLRDYHETWSSKFLDWLYPQGKELRKNFLEPIPAEVHAHFAASGRDFELSAIKRMLQDCDERFQLLLIGFHHMLESHETQRYLMDLEKYNPLFTILSRVKNNTRLVLCEIRTALQKLNAPYTVVDPATVRSSKEENENTSFYEWIIFREYLNQLEHLHQVIDAIDVNINASTEEKLAVKSLSG